LFTGLVEAIGTLRRQGASELGVRAHIATDLGALVLGESINVNGACLTVDRIRKDGFEADMSSETLQKTTLGGIPQGAQVHLERATPLGGRMGGHVVLGHVDGVGVVRKAERVGDTIRLEVACGPSLAGYLAEKGSIAIDGVSLTLNRISDTPDATIVEVMLVPHTVGRTRLGELRPGARVNIEVDVLARYVARQLETQRDVRARSGDHVKEVDEGPGGHDERLLEKLRAGGFA
jgi:riboflavin synthase